MFKKYEPLPKSKLEVKRGINGLGLFTKIDIRKGQYVQQYSGRLLNNSEANNKGGRYLFEVNARWTVDGNNKQNLAKYMNHSCRPNCDIRIKDRRVFLFALRKIKAGEELAYDSFIKPKGCHCPSSKHHK